jgi:hypothetical protein
MILINDHPEFKIFKCQEYPQAANPAEYCPNLAVWTTAGKRLVDKAGG